jgi:hypothetical protein
MGPLIFFIAAPAEMVALRRGKIASHHEESTAKIYPINLGASDTLFLYKCRAMSGWKLSLKQPIIFQGDQIQVVGAE